MKSTDRSTHYQIHIEGKLDDRWLRWFEGLEVTSSADNQTIIRQPLGAIVKRATPTPSARTGRFLLPPSP